jgi:hypothetical protein
LFARGAQQITITVIWITVGAEGIVTIWGVATIFMIRGTDEKAGMDSTTYSHVKEARTQKETSSGNCAEIEKDRGGDATKSF